MKKNRIYNSGIGFALCLLIAAGLVLLPAGQPYGAAAANAVGNNPAKAGTPFQFTPFTQDLPIPPTVQESAPFSSAICDTELAEVPMTAGLKAPKFYTVTMKELSAEIIPGVQTPMWGYDGMVPGPTFKERHNVPAIVRFQNDLNATTIVHNHGAHVAALSDGSASVNPEMLIPPGEFRDFCYPNIAPVDKDSGQQETDDFASTQWYHDHAHLPDIDVGITGQNVYMGLAGFYLLRDELEQGLIDNKVLPDEPFDIPVVLQDKKFAPDGQLIFDVNNFDGALGDVIVLNGKASPKLTVERRKYRFRFLNGATARWFELRLSSGEFLQIGNDTWLLEKAVKPITYVGANVRRDGTVRLGNAERADVIIDFTKAPDEVFLENIAAQSSGKRPEPDVVIPGVPILKFEVKGPPVANDVTVAEGTLLRPNKRITPDMIVKTREFVFERGPGGEWTINAKPFKAEVDDAQPQLNTAERWILTNKAGGWAHPIHLHLEAHQIQSYNVHPVPPQERDKKDTVKLEPNETAEVFFEFRTFPGRFVFHCHNLEHEDLAMMGTFNIGATPLPSFAIEPGAPGDPPMIEIGTEKALKNVGKEPAPPKAAAPTPPNTPPADVGTPPLSATDPAFQDAAAAEAAAEAAARQLAGSANPAPVAATAATQAAPATGATTAKAGSASPSATP